MLVKRVQQRLQNIVNDKDSGTEFAQIRIRLSLVRVRESNNVLQAVQTNPILFTKLGNKCFTMFDRRFNRNQTS